MKGLCGTVNQITGADTGGGGDLGVRTAPFGVTPKLHKEGKNMSRVCARMAHVLVLNSYADLSLSEILYPPLDNWFGIG